MRNAKNAETARADKAKSELDSLRSAYQNLIGKWYALWNEPEYNEATRKVKERKEREARLAEEKQDRYQNILNRFIAEGQTALRAFALSIRTNFNDKEAASIYYGIMAVAHKMELSLGAKEGITSAVNNFLSGMSWRDCSKFNEECITSWTHQFAERDVTYETSIIDNFISFVDYMSCNAKPTLHMVAPMAMLTNLQIGMVRRNSASTHKQRRKVNLTEAIKAIKLRAICNKCTSKSLSTVKMQQKKTKKYRSA